MCVRFDECACLNARAYASTVCMHAYVCMIKDYHIAADRLCAYVGCEGRALAHALNG